MDLYRINNIRIHLFCISSNNTVYEFSVQTIYEHDQYVDIFNVHSIQLILSDNFYIHFKHYIQINILN